METNDLVQSLAALRLHPHDSIQEATSPLLRDSTASSNPEGRVNRVVEETATEMDDSTDSFDAVVTAAEAFQSDETYRLSLKGWWFALLGRSVR
jgi:hypothetical protein